MATFYHLWKRLSSISNILFPVLQYLRRGIFLSLKCSSYPARPAPHTLTLTVAAEFFCYYLTLCHFQNVPVKPHPISNKPMNKPVFLRVHILLFKACLCICAEVHIVRQYKPVGNNNILEGYENCIKHYRRISVIENSFPA